MSSEDIYYRVSFAGRVADQLTSLEAGAIAAARHKEYTEALDIIVNWLRATPHPSANQSGIIHRYG